MVHSAYHVTFAISTCMILVEKSRPDSLLQQNADSAQLVMCVHVRIRVMCVTCFHKDKARRCSCSKVGIRLYMRVMSCVGAWSNHCFYISRSNAFN